LKGKISALIAKNNMPDAGIKLLLTGGYSSDGFSMGVPNLVITQSVLPSYKAHQSSGIRIITYQHQRQMPEVKTIDYLMAVWLQPTLQDAAAQDVLYYDHNGLITECPRSNIFIVTHDDRVLTPAKNVLKGIIRSQLLQCAGTHDISEALITRDDLYQAKEVFVTSTTKNILPVSQVDEHIINGGRPGVVTTELAATLHELINSI
jgi:branched-chain amino acid aminotransferase